MPGQSVDRWGEGHGFGLGASGTKPALRDKPERYSQKDPMRARAAVRLGKSASAENHVYSAVEKILKWQMNQSRGLHPETVPECEDMDCMRTARRIASRSRLMSHNHRHRILNKKSYLR